MTVSSSRAGLLLGRAVDRVEGRRRRRLRLAPVVFLAPALTLLVLFRVWPLLDGFRLSLTDWSGFSNPVYVGADNFIRAAQSPDVRAAFVTNAQLLLISLPLKLVVPYVAASLISARIWGWRSFRVLFFLPVALSPAIIGLFFEILLRYDGPVNTVMRQIGLGAFAREWLVDPTTALPVLGIIFVWSTFGVGVLLFLAAFQDLDPALTDAGRVDGAGWWTMQRHIVLPQVRSVAEFWAVMAVISSFTSVFPLVFTLTGGGPGNRTAVIDFYIYKQAFQSGALGYASAVGVCLLVLLLCVIAIQLRLVRKGER